MRALQGYLVRYSNKKIHTVGWVGTFFQDIFPLRGSILLAGTCQIISLAKNPRWSRVWQLEEVINHGSIGGKHLKTLILFGKQAL